MTTIYLIRHCEAEGNLYRRIHGIFDSPATPKGLRQLDALARRMAPVALHAIYASHLVRAVETAKALAVPRGLPVHVQQDLAERSMGDWEDYTWHEIKARHPATFDAWQQDLSGYIIPNGESEQQAGTRLGAALSRMAEAHPGQTIAVVSHSMAIKALQAATPGASPQPGSFGDNTSVNVLAVENGRLRFSAVNDNSHLTADLSSTKHQQWAWGKLESYSLLYKDGDGTGLSGWQGGVEVVTAQVKLHTGEARVNRLYVPPPMRQNGYASQMLGEVMARRRRRGGGRLLVASPREETAAFPAFCRRNALEKAEDGWWQKTVPRQDPPLFRLPQDSGPALENSR